FTAENQDHVNALWKSDGTPAGTSPITPLPDTNRSVSQLMNANGRLFFKVHPFGAQTDELWKSDGTAAGTSFVSDMLDLPHLIYMPDGKSLPSIDGTVFFAAHGSSGAELWKSDGTAAGTTLVKDINPGPNDANPREFRVINNVLLFAATDGIHGNELWKS